MSSTRTLREAAEELGVHYMTAYRYVRMGLLDAEKVAGVWQVGDEAIVEFRSGSATGPVTAGAPAPWSQRFEARLVDADAQGAWKVVESAMASGTDLRAVYLEVISPAMVSIGARWAAGEFDISVEHQATGIVMRIIGRLGPKFARRGRTLGDVVVGAPPGESHALPTAMLGDLLSLHGWHVVDLGANTPCTSFLHVADRLDSLRGVGLSVTNSQHLASAEECCRAIKEVYPDVLLVVGGAGLADCDPATLGADAVAGSADQLHELLAAS